MAGGQKPARKGATVSLQEIAGCVENDAHSRCSQKDRVVYLREKKPAASVSAGMTSCKRVEDRKADRRRDQS